MFDLLFSVSCDAKALIQNMPAHFLSGGLVFPGYWLSSPKSSQLARSYKLFHSLKHSQQALGINTTTNDWCVQAFAPVSWKSGRLRQRGEAIEVFSANKLGLTLLDSDSGQVIHGSLLAESQMWVIFAVFTGHQYSSTIHPFTPTCKHIVGE